MTEKANKEDVDFGKGMAERHCGPMFNTDRGYCAHFIEGRAVGPSGSGTCSKVKGPIKRSMWCRLFKKAVTK